ncbi:MAG: FG-GAP-like repeat-containing protein, partial [Gammaproteobacteria bacterium]
QGNTSTLGTVASVTNTVNINVQPINIAPINKIVSPINTINENSSLTINNLSIVDQDNPNGYAEVTLVANNGTINLSGRNGLTFTSGTYANCNSMTFKGTMSDINNALLNAIFTPNVNFVGTASINITTNDLGNGGVSVNQQITNSSMYFKVLPVDQPSVITIPNANIDVTLIATNGTLTLSGNYPSLTFVQGTGVNNTSIEIQGTLSDLNNALANLIFIPNFNFSGNANVKIITNDLGHYGSGSLQDLSGIVASNMHLNVIPVNYAPTNLLPTTQVINENNNLILSNASGNALQILDPTLMLGQELTVTLSSTNGTLSLANPTIANIYSGATGINTSSVTFSGNLASINAALDNLVFTPNVNFSGAASISITSNDNSKTDTDIMNINVMPINLPPTITVPGGQIINKNATFTFGTGNLITVADDSLNDQMQIVLNITNGTLTLGGSTANLISVSGNGSNQVTLIGRTSDLNIVLANSIFTPTSNFVGVANISMQTSDLGHGLGTIGGTKVANTTIDIGVINPTITNIAPINNLPSSITVNENQLVTFSAANSNAFSISDVDAQDNPVKITLTSTNGTLSLLSTNNLTAVNASATMNTNTITLTGSISNINQALANGLIFTPNTNFIGTSTIQLSTNDLGSTGTGGSKTTNNTMNVITTVYNDTPINKLTTYVSVNENSILSLSSTNIQIDDRNADNNLMQVTLSSTNGALRFNGSTTGLTFTQGDVGAFWNPVLTFNGTKANINSALNNLQFNPTYGYIGSANIQINTTNLVTTGGGNLTATNNIHIGVLGTNNIAPTNTTYIQQAVNENSWLLFNNANSNSIKVGDVDYATGTEQVTITATNGTISLNTLKNVTIVTGTGTNDTTVTITGTIVNLNNAIDSLRFTPNLNYTGMANIQVSINDLGNTGGSAQINTQNININVNGVNQAPVNLVPTAQTIAVNQPLILAGAQAINIVDVDSGNNIIKVTVSADNGLLSLSQTTGLTFINGNGSNSSVQTFTGSLANINAALNKLIFTPNHDFIGTANIQVVSNDQDLGNPKITTSNIAVNIGTGTPTASNITVNAVTNINNSNTILIPINQIVSNDINHNANSNIIGASVVFGDGTVSLNGNYLVYNGNTFKGLNIGASANVLIKYVLTDGSSVSNGVINLSGINNPNLTAASNQDLIITGNNNITANNVSHPIVPAVVMSSNSFPDANSNVGVSTAVDLNADGKVDIVHYDATTKNLVWYNNNGNGGFTASSNSNIASGLTSVSNIISGDFNNDGKVDLFVANGTNSKLFVNDGLGNFTASAPISGNVVAAISGMFNNDSNIDLIYLLQNSQAYIATGKGDGTFNTPTAIANTSFSATLSPSAIQVIDFNKDGSMDFLLITGSGQQTAWYQNNGSGSFTQRIIQNSYQTAAIAAGDLYNNGLIDVVTIDLSTPTIRIFKNAGNNTTFTSTVVVNDPDLTGATSIAVADLNKDGNLDIIAMGTTGAAAGHLVAYLNDGYGNFTKYVNPASFASYGINQSLNLTNLIDNNGLPSILTGDNWFTISSIDNNIIGTSGKDYIDAGGAPTGSLDQITGNGGADHFVFKPGYKLASITDFNNANQIDLSAFGLQGGENDPRLQISIVGNNTIINIDNNNTIITLNNYTNLNANNFIFYASPSFNNFGTNSTNSYFTTGSPIFINNSNNFTIAAPNLDRLNNGLGDYNNARLIIGRSNGANSQDLFNFSFDPASGIYIDGNNLLDLNNNIIATLNSSITGQLVINFVSTGGSIATTAIVNSIVHAVQYSNISANVLTDNISVNYAFNDGSSNNQNIVSQSININFNPTNQPPINNIPNDQSVYMNQPLTLSGNNAISVNDPDQSNNIIKVTVSTDNGSLSLSQTTGLTFINGNGLNNATQTFTGSLSNVNAALNGLIFTPTNNFIGSSKIQIVTNDRDPVNSKVTTSNVNVQVGVGAATSSSNNTINAITNITNSDNVSIPMDQVIARDLNHSANSYIIDVNVIFGNGTVSISGNYLVYHGDTFKGLNIGSTANVIIKYTLSDGVNVTTNTINLAGINSNIINTNSNQNIVIASDNNVLTNQISHPLTSSSIDSNIIGTTGNDYIDAGGAASGSYDQISGNGGSDQFVFKPGYKATVITDFNSQSFINLSAFGLQGINDSNLMINIVGNDTIITIPNVDFRIKLANYTDPLQVSNFIFYAAPTINNVNLISNNIYNGQAPILINSDPNFSISDPNLNLLNSGLGDYNNSQLMVYRFSGSNANDKFSFGNMQHLQIVDNYILDFNNNIIATLNNAIPGKLMLTFCSDNGIYATTSLVNEILRAITYSNSADNPPGNVNLIYVFNDNIADNAYGVVTTNTIVNIQANQSPINIVPSSQNVYENSPNLTTGLTFTGDNGITITDLDAGAGLMTISLVANHGSLTFSS